MLRQRTLASAASVVVLGRYEGLSDCKKKGGDVLRPMGKFSGNLPRPTSSRLPQKRARLIWDLEI